MTPPLEAKLVRGGGSGLPRHKLRGGAFGGVICCPPPLYAKLSLAYTTGSAYTALWYIYFILLQGRYRSTSRPPSYTWTQMPTDALQRFDSKPLGVQSKAQSRLCCCTSCEAGQRSTVRSAHRRLENRRRVQRVGCDDPGARGGHTREVGRVKGAGPDLLHLRRNNRARQSNAVAMEVLKEKS
eukprot:4950084-Pyramimonas_sp.AAC.1